MNLAFSKIYHFSTTSFILRKSCHTAKIEVLAHRFTQLQSFFFIFRLKSSEVREVSELEMVLHYLRAFVTI